MFNALSANEVNAMKINGGYITYGLSSKATLTSDENGALWYGDGSMTTSLQGDYSVRNQSFINPTYNANTLMLTNNNSSAMTYLANYDPREGKVANTMYLFNNPGYWSRALISNYNVEQDSRFVQNEVKLNIDYRTSDSTIELNNNDFDGTYGNMIWMISNPTSKNRIDIVSFEYGTENLGSYLVLHGNGNTTLKGYVNAVVAAANTASLQADEKAEVYSVKNVFIYGGENITAQSAGDIQILGTDKVEINGAEIDLTSNTVKLGSKTLYFRTRDGVTYVCAQ